MAGFTEFELSHKAYLVNGYRTIQGGDITLAGNQTTDYPDTGGKRAPEGMVVVKETGDGLYYPADAANDGAHGDRNAAAVVASLEAADTDWDGTTITIEITYPDGTVISDDVLLAGTDDSTSEVVTLINGRQKLEGHVVASGNDGQVLTLTTVKKGNVHLKVTSDLATAYGANGVEDDGVQADYRVITRQADTVDLDGASYTPVVPSLIAGAFDESELSNLTNEAKAVLLGNGSSFQ